MIPRWHQDALCRTVDDPNIFYPELGEGSKKARQVCRWCRVRVECLEWGLANERFGIWGGKSAYQRRQIRAQRRLAEEAA